MLDLASRRKHLASVLINILQPQHARCFLRQHDGLFITLHNLAELFHREHGGGGRAGWGRRRLRRARRDDEGEGEQNAAHNKCALPRGEGDKRSLLPLGETHKKSPLPLGETHKKSPLPLGEG